MVLLGHHTLLRRLPPQAGHTGVDEQEAAAPAADLHSKDVPSRRGASAQRRGVRARMPDLPFSDSALAEH